MFSVTQEGLIVTKSCGRNFSVTQEGFIVIKSCGRNHAVTHPMLADLPFVKSIEEWVRGCFPWAEYLQSASPTIDVPDLTFPGIVALQGVKGLGKSKSIAAAVAALPADTTVLLVTFRCALAWSSMGVLGSDTKMYSDINGLLVPSEHPRASVLINSIGRVAGLYDVVVVDEIVSIIDMLAGELMKKPELRVKALHAFQTILQGAKCIVTADAMLDSSCIRFLLSCRNAATPTPLRVHDNVTRIHDDYVYVAHENRQTWEAELAACVISGQRVVVACMTKTMAMQLVAQFADTYDVTSYCGDDDPAVLQTHMKDIHTHWKACQILVYSPVITAGCSFELPHFDVVFFYGKPKLGSVRSAIQMISRVRDISRKRVHVFISENADDAGSSTYSMLSDGAAGKPPAPYCHHFPKPEDMLIQLLEQLEDFQNKEVAIAAQAFQYHFWYLVVQSGASIVFSHQHLLPIVPHHLLEEALAACRNVRSRDTNAFVGRESVLAHAWDGPQVGKGAVGPGMKLLQRAAALHYEHVVAANVLQGVGVKTVENHGPSLKTERDARTLSWLFLSALSSIHIPGFTLIRRDEFTTDSLRRRVAGTITRFKPAALTSKWLPDSELEDLWILAAMDASVRGQKPLPVTPAVLKCPKPLEEPCFAEFINTVLSGLHPQWVGVHVKVNGGMVDVLVEDVHGGWHVVVVRSTGAPDALFDYDLLKGLALCAALPHFVNCKSVVFLYLQAMQSVAIDVSAWRTYPFRKLLFEDAYKPRGDGVVYMVFDTFGAVNVRNPVSGHCTTFLSLKDALKTLTAHSEARIVSWGFRDAYCEEFADRIHDLEYVVAQKLRCASWGKALNILKARTLHPQKCWSTDTVATLMNLYTSALQNGTVVYFNDVVPVGIAVYSIPPASFYERYIIKREP